MSEKFWDKYTNWLYGKERKSSKNMEEIMALDDLIETYSEKLETNNTRIQGMRETLNRLEKENEAINSKIAVAIRKIKELEGEDDGTGNFKDDGGCYAKGTGSLSATA